MSPLVLVVDDDLDLRTAVGEVLEEEGYRVAQADNGETALALLRGGERPSLVLLDVMMPVLNGEQFLALQRTEPSIAEIPIVILTAAGLSEEYLGKLDADAVLEKPVPLRELLETVKKFVSVSS
jgi:CheY-like chemotaxis protein